MNSYPKYRYPETAPIADRIWPTRKITAAPMFASVDLRDGNQAFANPMDVDAKVEYFKMLTRIGFTEIEVGFPAASRDEFDFVRRLIEENLIPAGVRIVVFTQARAGLIARTIESIRGVERAVVHCYVAASDLHGRFVFGKSREEVRQMAVEGTRMIVEAIRDAGLQDRVGYEFSPEEFTDSDIDFIVDLACGVKECFGPCRKENFILNLPSTVERRPPYQYADLIEYFCRHYPYGAETTISVHTHNDQGCAIAAAEMAVLAGADRVEGTLCGHGERTGNMDMLTFALNFHSRGIATGLDFSFLPEIVRQVEKVSSIATHPRHPYAGELVFTAFSGSHQDAIRKGFAQREAIGEFFRQGWKLPYFHIDPADIGRSYEGLIRINSQSGKGGVAFVMEQVYGVELPKSLQTALAHEVQLVAEASKAEVAPEEIFAVFEQKIVNPPGGWQLVGLKQHNELVDGRVQTQIALQIAVSGPVRTFQGRGNGPIAATVDALQRAGVAPEFRLESYKEQAMTSGAAARAIACIGLRMAGRGEVVFGVGINENIAVAAVHAILNALNRASRPE
ncbi:2-isopropylmalate synthase [Victivallis sp. Marseille-Q1083]|uniref:2-isopropylmalate synthase n=1 Tax=Victivallis sp. Marseille-Q1083 TaxID=2717288 RepID=UPI00158AD37F|nr:2-isopropylmalate synthase [Victivallis sp. Marseille-Q1083]